MLTSSAVQFINWNSWKVTGMALQLIRNSLRSSELLRGVAAFSTSQKCFDEGDLPARKLELHTATIRDALTQDDKARYTLVPVKVENDISKISGVPTEHIKGRRVRIYKFSKNAMQSGTNNVGVWQLDFETRQRWENPLMGWASTGDPLSNMKVQFCNKDEAIDFAEKNGWEWYLDEGTPVKPKVKSYGFNFSWNKRSRVSTK